MKKLLLVLVSVLLLTGVAQATDWQTALTADLSARNIGRCRVTDSSTVLKVWSNGTLASPGIGVSANSILRIYYSTITETAANVSTHDTSFDTIGEIVDYINTSFASDSSVGIFAAVGPDAYRDMSAVSLEATNIQVLGQGADNASTIDTANSRLLSAGAEGKAGVTNRLKGITPVIPINPGVGSYIHYTVYDGNTRVWRTTVSATGNSTILAPQCSGNTIEIGGDKGISSTKGNSICVVATTDGNVDTDTQADAIHSISIVYDQYRD